MKPSAITPAKVLVLVLAYAALGTFLVAFGGHVSEVAGTLAICFAASLIALQRGSGSCGRLGRK